VYYKYYTQKPINTKKKKKKRRRGKTLKRANNITSWFSPVVSFNEMQQLMIITTPERKRWGKKDCLFLPSFFQGGFP
jgi:hypothetical protein